jgi:hypothetical protein
MANGKKEKLLDNLTHEMAVSILKKLYEDEEVRQKLINLAEAALQKIDADEIANDVFCELNMLDVQDIYNDSGSTYHGYVEPSELAHTMAEDAVEPFVRDIAKYRELGMKKEEMETCRGILRGLVKYENNGDNEFKDWIPDSIMQIAEDIVDEYGKHNTESDMASIKSEIEN